ncbi:MAG: hypothetical protein H6679_02000 [Epsilonproteobacteria bacterium]|nr:hypothetical protein [Campylobacterota bacterium]
MKSSKIACLVFACLVAAKLEAGRFEGCSTKALQAKMVQAVRGGQTDIVKEILEIGRIDVNHGVQEDGQTGMTQALADHNNPLWIKRNKDKARNDALICIAVKVMSAGQTAILEQLLEAGANVFTLDKNGTPVVVIAVEQRKLEALRLLLEHKPDLFQKYATQLYEVAQRAKFFDVVTILDEQKLKLQQSSDEQKPTLAPIKYDDNDYTRISRGDCVGILMFIILMPLLIQMCKCSPTQL